MFRRGPERSPRSPFSAGSPADLGAAFPRREDALSTVAAGLVQALRDAAPLPTEIDTARDLCRNGNPFPLIAAQWPFLLITDPAEAAYFQGEIGNTLNPCLRLDDWQRDLIASGFDESITIIAVKGNTKAGKGGSTSIFVSLWYDVYPDAKIILTSQRFDHAVDVIFGEVCKWRAKMTSPSAGRRNAASIDDTDQHYVSVVNSQTGEGFSGQHGPRTLFVMDEATSISEGHFNDANKQARKIVCLANPRVLGGWLYDLYKPLADMNVTETYRGPMGGVRCFTVDGAYIMNVRNRRLERPIAPYGGIEIDGLHYKPGDSIPPAAYQTVRPLIPDQCDYGRWIGICQNRDENHVRVFARGWFPKEDADKQVILPSWLPRHEAAWHSGIAVDAFGFDVARSKDGDATFFAAGGKDGLRALHGWKYADTTYHVAEALRIAKEFYGIDLRQGVNPVAVDMDGLGAGVGDQLRQLGVWVIEIHGGAAAQVEPQKYANLRAELYGLLGRRFNPDEQWGASTWAIPFDPDLKQELTAPEKIPVGTDHLRFRISPKHRDAAGPGVVSIQEKIGRSPDRADATVYLFAAVREFHDLNEWIRSNQRPLVVWPQPAENESGPGNSQTAPVGNMLDWLKQRDSYQKRSESDPIHRLLSDDSW